LEVKLNKKSFGDRAILTKVAKEGLSEEVTFCLRPDEKDKPMQRLQVVTPS
jgi:hypothetical protein